MPTPTLERSYAANFIAAIRAAIRAGYKAEGRNTRTSRGERSALRVACDQFAIPRGSMHSHLAACERALGITFDWQEGEGPAFTTAKLPSADAPVEELIERRKKQFARKNSAADARSLIPVKINIDGPIGIVHFGDPHIDDDGTDIALLERHIEIIKTTPGMFGANVGDLQNNWVGRLAFLWSQQSTSAAESWQLTEWLVRAIPWLYLIRGNHDLWSGEGDPIKWMMQGAETVTDAWGARLELQFPNGKKIRINARHDFSGHSMWNTAHGPAKAVQMGWRDHILTCGHKHISGYQVLKDPATGLVSHAIRVGSYKIHDRYAAEQGLPNQNIFPAAVTIIDPAHDDDDPRLITTMFDVARSAEFLTYLRRDHAKANRR